MSFALHPTNVIPVTASADWDSADDVVLDVKAALEDSFPGVFKFPMTETLTVSLVNYYSTGSEKGVYVIAATTGSGTASTAFDTQVDEGVTVYLISMY